MLDHLDFWEALSKKDKSGQNNALTVNIFTDHEFVFFVESYSNVQMLWNLERTSRTKLSTMHKKIGFFLICYELFLNRVQMSPGSELDIRF